MANTYASLNIHVVFSTKQRQLVLRPEFQGRIWSYIGGITRKHGMKALAVGGAPDHIHLLLALPTTKSVAKAVMTIKGNSSKWINDNIHELRPFAWQKGYSAFTVSASKISDAVRYINGQATHHKRKTFKDEYIEFLKRHEVHYDEKYVWG